MLDCGTTPTHALARGESILTGEGGEQKSEKKGFYG